MEERHGTSFDGYAREIKKCILNAFGWTNNKNEYRVENWEETRLNDYLTALNQQKKKKNGIKMKDTFD